MFVFKKGFRLNKSQVGMRRKCGSRGGLDVLANNTNFFLIKLSKRKLSLLSMSPRNHLQVD